MVQSMNVVKIWAFSCNYFETDMLNLNSLQNNKILSVETQIQIKLAMNV